MNAVIRTQALQKKFGRTVALAGIDLEVPEGAIYALVGANGAGKTTLIKLLMNIFQPTSGSAQVLGIDSRHIAGQAFERIGYVSENQEMPDWMTLGQLLDYYRNFYPEWDAALEQQLIRQFDLPLNRKLKHMSRGMKMKAAFASSLPYRPALIVLDEPFSGLDPLVRDELIEVLLDRAPETTIFLSSHDLADIEAFSSHVGYLENGRLLFSEEMASLTGRFREITITLAEPLSRPFTPPAHWLQCESVDRVLRFVHSRYDSATARDELAAQFPDARDIAIEPMSLRAIFLAVAKAGRTQTTVTTIEAEPREIQA
jgi:ABC-2 type transport system ATP-binding protein